jgi:hypothetical protein
LTKLVDAVHVDFDSEVVVRNGRFGFGETGSDDLAHVGSGSVDILSAGGGGRGSLSGSRGGRGRGGGRLEFLDILLEDATFGTGTLDLGERNTLLESETLGHGSSEDDGTVRGEFESSRFLGSRSFLLGFLLLRFFLLGLLLGLLFLGLLLLGSFTRFSYEGVDGRLGEIVSLLSEDCDGRSDLNGLRSVSGL